MNKLFHLNQPSSRTRKLPRYRLLGLAFLACVNCVAISIGSAQTTQPISITAPSVLADGSPTAAITFPSGASLPVRSQRDLFPLVAADAGGILNIQLRFPVSLAGATIIAQALDGGIASIAQDNLTIAADGTASIQFQAASQPGLYRIVLDTAGVITALQFWVANSQDPSANPPALTP
jgi:hypothetical protein